MINNASQNSSSGQNTAVLDEPSKAKTSTVPRQPKIIVTMPAYNAAKTLLKTFEDIPKGTVSEIILVDDCSKDDTAAVGTALNLKVIRHPHNVGYGGNQKTCYLEALRDGADIVIMLHPDYQYDPRKVPDMVAPILNGEADIVLGSRFIDGGALKGGMPMYKYISNRCLTFFQNKILGTDLSEFHTGYRAYSRQFLERVPFLRNSISFTFDAEILCQAVFFGFRISEIGVETRYFPEASSINFLNSVKYGFGVLGSLGQYWLAKNRIIDSVLFKP
jgi:glycosyltransferase involved in cell wall biosynthesis